MSLKPSMYKDFKFGGFLLKMTICQFGFVEILNVDSFARTICRTRFCPPHRFIEEPHGSKETHELTAGAEVVQWHVLDGKRRLRVRRRSGSDRRRRSNQKQKLLFNITCPSFLWKATVVKMLRYAR